MNLLERKLHLRSEYARSQDVKNRNYSDRIKHARRPGVIPREEYLTRAIEFAVRGNDLPHAKLNSDLVREIRINRHGLTAKAWAEKLGLHQRTIDKVRDFKSWRHV